MLNMRKIGIIFSVMIMAMGLLILMKIPYFYWHSQTQGSKLIKNAKAKTVTVKQVNHAVSNIKKPSKGETIGLVNIPFLSLTAPILEGTTDKILNHGSGHLSTSVMPGEAGTSVIAAHNVTWFRHINQLKKGSAIQIKTSYGKFHFDVTGSKVVHTGDPVYNTSRPSLVLEACYPLNALHLTPYRYLVYAKMDGSNRWQSIGTQKVHIKKVTAMIPKDLKKNNLTIAKNSLLLGKLKYTGSPSKVFTESQMPLSAANSLVQLYLAWLHASANKDLSDLKSMIPNYKKDPFFGEKLSGIHNKTAFNVTLNVNHSTLQSISGTVQPFVKGIGRFKVKITAIVKGYKLANATVDVKKSK